MEIIPPDTWLSKLKKEVQKPYFTDLQKALRHAYASRTIYPAQEHIFNAFELTALSDIKVVILGQDPYHGENQAHGLSFSVPTTAPIPPSLRNIYTEIHNDIGHTSQVSGNLERWAVQGVFLLNSTLTVEAKDAGSHQGWVL